MSKYDRYEVYSWATNAMDFVAKQQKIKIAEYARDYEWNPTKVAEILEEFATAKERKQHFFFGTILYTIRRMAKTNDLYKNVYEVTLIDGQQRLTTLMTILLALRYLLRKHEKSEDSSDVVKAIDRLLTVEMDGELKLRFEPTSHNDEATIFNQIVHADQNAWIKEELAKPSSSERADLQKSLVWQNFKSLVEMWKTAEWSTLAGLFDFLSEEVYFVEVSFRDDEHHDLPKIYRSVNNLK